jgi:hypothetical protein
MISKNRRRALNENGERTKNLRIKENQGGGKKSRKDGVAEKLVEAQRLI